MKQFTVLHVFSLPVSEVSSKLCSAHPPSLCPHIWAKISYDAQAQCAKHFSPLHQPLLLYMSLCSSCVYNLVQSGIDSTNSFDPKIPSLSPPFLWLSSTAHALCFPVDFDHHAHFFLHRQFLSVFLISPSFCLFNQVADCPVMCGLNRKAVTRTQFWISTSFSHSLFFPSFLHNYNCTLPLPQAIALHHTWRLRHWKNNDKNQKSLNNLHWNCFKFRKTFVNKTELHNVIRR